MSPSISTRPVCLDLPNDILLSTVESDDNKTSCFRSLLRKNYQTSVCISEFIIAFIQIYICINPTTYMGISYSVKILHKTSLDIESWDFLTSNQKMMHCPITFQCLVKYLKNGECMISNRYVSSKSKQIKQVSKQAKQANQAQQANKQAKQSKRSKQGKAQQSKQSEASKQLII